MKYAQDAKTKVPNMTELVSDLALRYLETETEEHATPVDQLMAHVYQLALARVLFTITAQQEWATKANNHRLEGNRLKVQLVKNDIGVRTPTISVAV